MLKKNYDYPWFFINSEMLHFSNTLSESKLKNDKEKLAKAIFELTSSRFQSPKYSIRIFKTYASEVAYKIWEQGGNTGSLKQSIAIKAMLLATGCFSDKDIRILRTEPPHYTPASGGHFYLKVKLDKSSVYQDSWGREWKVAYGERFVSGKDVDYKVPKVMGEWNRKYRTPFCTLCLKL